MIELIERVLHEEANQILYANMINIKLKSSPTLEIASHNTHGFWMIKKNTYIRARKCCCEDICIWGRHNIIYVIDDR